MKNKTQLIQDIGTHVLSASYLTNAQWRSLSLVIDIGREEYAENALLYLDNETKHFFVDDNSELEGLLDDLCDIIKAEVNLAAVQSLIQVNSDDKKVKLNFEFYNKELWSITPENISQKIIELRLKEDEAQ